MKYTLCNNCDFCNTDRKTERGQVRCIRFSQWVEPNQQGCNHFFNEAYYTLLKHLLHLDELPRRGRSK